MSQLLQLQSLKSDNYMASKKEKSNTTITIENNNLIVI